MKKLLVLFLAMLMLSSMSFAGIRDKNIDWSYATKFIPASQFTGYVDHTGVAAGTPAIAEISTFGITGLALAADNDSLETVLNTEDIDVTKPVYVRVVWTANETTNNTMTFTVEYDNIGSTAIIAPATALDTTIGYTTGESTTVAYVVNRSTWGKINANKLTKGGYFTIEVISVAGTATITNVKLLGIELKYTPNRTEGSGMNREAR